jgi:hypothetical protein
MIYMLGFGYGLGSLLPDVGGVSYIAFIAAGAVCFSTMNAATFEALYSAFSRMQVQRTWDAILNAPMALDDLVLAELVWAASKAALSGAAILAVAAALGLVASPLALWAAAGDLPDRAGLRRAGADHDGAGAELRFLHVLLHPGRHADDAALRRVLPGGAAAGRACRRFRPRCRCRMPCSWRGRCSSTRCRAGPGCTSPCSPPTPSPPSGWRWGGAARRCRLRLPVGPKVYCRQLATGNRPIKCPMETLLVITALPDAETARALAARLVERRLGACVNILAPCQSLYRWEDKLEEAEEVPLLMKTRRRALRRAGRGHPRLPPLRTSGDRRGPNRQGPARLPGLGGGRNRRPIASTRT